MRSSLAGVLKLNRRRRSYSTAAGGGISKCDIVSMNKIITNHAKSGRLEDARKVFDEMPERTVVSWNTMISGYSEWGKHGEALRLVSLMHRSNTRLNESTFSSVLSVCARSVLSSEGKQVHCLVLKYGCESFRLVGSSLLYFYSNCYEIEEARRVFDELHERNELLWSLMLVGYVQCNLMNDASISFDKMPSRDVIAWTTLISGYSKTEQGARKALELFALMRQKGDVEPNEFTLDCVIRACDRCVALRYGKAVHGLVIRVGCEIDISICGALIDFYCNCMATDDAKRVYGELINPSLSDSNALIAGLVMAGKIEEARLVFDCLMNRNPVSYNLMIKGYSLCGRVEESKRLFSEMRVRTLTSMNTMISVYSRNHEIEKALELFEEAKREQSPVTWNSMISGYIQNDQHENALKLYIEMRQFPVNQTRSTFSALFHACSCLGSLLQGQLIHAHLTKTPFDTNVYVGTALVDMYSKCGTISDAQKSFLAISCPNVAAWTAMINAYAQHGLGLEATSTFEHMLEQRVHPNAATLVAVLSACAHTGLVSEGLRIFDRMESCFGITPTLEHFTCIVDLLGRSGHLREAEELVNGMSIEPDNVLLIALLNACQFWTDLESGERIVGKILSSDHNPVPGCIIMSNMYAGSGRWGEKIQARKSLSGFESKKPPGCSWIEVNNIVHMFSIHDRTHPFYHAIYSTLENITASMISCNNSDFVSSRLTVC